MGNPRFILVPLFLTSQEVKFILWLFVKIIPNRSIKVKKYQLQERFMLLNADRKPLVFYNMLRKIIQAV